MNTPPAVRGYDPNRMRRAALLACVKLGPGQYRVQGQDEPFYDVDLSVDPACYCADQFHRRAMCKHEICARLHDGDEKLMDALGAMLLEQEKRIKELMKQTKKRRPRTKRPDIHGPWSDEDAQRMDDDENSPLSADEAFGRDT